MGSGVDVLRTIPLFETYRMRNTCTSFVDKFQKYDVAYST